MLDKLPDSRIEVRATVSQCKISDVFGSLKQPNGQRHSIEEIKRAAAKGWAGR